MHGQQLPRQKGEPHRQPPQAVIDHGTLGSQDTRGLRACTGAAAAGRRRTLAQVVGHGAVVAAQDLLDNQTALVAQQVDRRQRRQRHEHQREEHRACAAARAPTRSGPSRPAPTTAGGAPCMRRRLTGQGGAACPSLIPSALTARCGAAVRAAAAGAAHPQTAHPQQRAHDLLQAWVCRAGERGTGKQRRGAPAGQSRRGRGRLGRARLRVRVGAPRRFCAPTLVVSSFQKMPPQNRPTTAAVTQCIISSAGLRRISVSVRLNSTATSRMNGVRGGAAMGGRGVAAAVRAAPRPAPSERAPTS